MLKRWWKLHLEDNINELRKGKMNPVNQSYCNPLGVISWTKFAQKSNPIPNI